MTEPIDPKILELIREHHIFTLAVTRGLQPWCATCFYVYDEETNRFIFTSDEDTRHIKDVVETGNYRAAGAIALETKMVGKIRGIQFSGTIWKPEGDVLKITTRKYLHKFPVARLSRLSLWCLTPDILKLTDNRLGFGKKIIWKS
jgi:uncharacterized protein